MQLVVIDNRNSHPGKPPSPLLQNSKRQWLEQAIVDRILIDDAFVENAVVALFSKQEPKEQESKRTLVQNRRGFNKPDAGVFSAMAEHLLAGHRLSAEELAICRKPSKGGMPRLGKYRRQLAEIFQADLLPNTGANSDSVDSGAGNGVRK